MKFYLSTLLLLLAISCNKDYSVIESQESRNLAEDFNVYSFCFNGSDEIYVSTKSDTLYYSKDRGKNWQVSQVFKEWDTNYIWKVRIISNNRILVVLNESIYYSSLDTLSWLKIFDIPTQFGGIELTDFVKLDSSFFFVADYFYKCNTNLENWSRLSFPHLARAIEVSSDTIIIGATEYADVPPATGRIYRSVDLGKSFVKVADVYEAVFDLCKTSNGYLFAATFTDIYTSHDFGRNWHPCGFDTLHRTPNHKIFMKIIRDMNDNLYAFTRSGEVYLSENYGKNWIEMSKLYYPNDVHVDEDNVVYVGTYKGLFYSNDQCRTWNLIEISIK